MALSKDLISQFVKATKDDTSAKKETIVYGTIVEYDGSKYVRIDGSELLTPIKATSNVENEERVTVSIENHMAIVTGNLTSPAARSKEVEEIGTKISEFEIIIADKVDTIELNAVIGRIDELTTDHIVVKNGMEANAADIKTLTADNVTIKGQLDVHSAWIQKAEVDYLKAEDADLKYANIDFSNIGTAAIEYFYATSGLIKDVTVGDGIVTGELVGVTIKGDLIEGGTVIADKLVIKGEDGLYYKLNTDGVTTESEQTDYNSLNGSIITAKSITASKVSVEDLVAFDATIGGFKITDDAIHSITKDSVDNTTRGVYLNNNGEVSIGDASNYLMFYQDSNGRYRLAISADSFIFSGSGKSVEDMFDELGGEIDVGGRNLIRNTDFSKNVLDKWIKWGTETVFTVIDNDYMMVNNYGSAASFGVYGASKTSEIFADQEYTLSFDAYADTDLDLSYCHLMGDEGQINLYDLGVNPHLTSESQHFSFTFTAPSEITCSLMLAAIETGSYTGSFYFKNLKLERGTVDTDWTPAVEDLQSDISSLESEVVTHSTQFASLRVDLDSVSASVKDVEKTVTSSMDGVVEDIATLTKQIETKMSAEEVELQIKSELVNGASKVTTTTGYTLDQNGLSISKTGSEMSTTISEDGMTVYKDEEEVLKANNEGVNAVNLRASTYLIIGQNSRFEDWGNRTACFWIGN